MTKDLKELAKITTSEIQDILGVAHETHPQEITDAIEKSIIKALVDERQRCAGIAKDYLNDDAEKAKQLSDEIGRGISVLITNLSAMR
ncbi:MAG: hypothetical protein GY761_17200 [Hyphomicrobiales bacterium]|nr:hypothetical protein [Hyphomicrobiales bacterium]